MNTEEFLAVFITASKPDEARKIADALVSSKLAACVNILPGCLSVYRWEGKVVVDDEVLMIVKTTRRCFDELEKLVLKLHSYDVPEIAGVPFSAVSDGYKSFLQDATR